MKTHLSKKAVQTIEEAVDKLYDSAKERFLGPGAYRSWGKKLVFGFPEELSLVGLFAEASRAEGASPREEVLHTLLRVAAKYIDSRREHTKARVVAEVHGFIEEANEKGIKTDPRTVLQGRLTEVWKDAKADIKKIVESESTRVRNTGLFDAATRIAAMSGQSDPTMFFVVVRDGNRCEECTELHLMPDKVTPRLWKRSEIGASYHKRGDKTPKIGGLHPHCRCFLTVLLPGYGFDSSGKVKYIKPGYDAYAESKAEAEPE
jgi:hypothetical protein